MTTFNRVSPGTPLAQSPVRSSRWLNAVSQSAEAYQNAIAGGASKGDSLGLKRPTDIVKVRNLTGANRTLGQVVQLGAELLESIDPRNLWFEGNTIAAPVLRKLAIIRSAVAAGEIGEAQVSGVCVASVDVTDIAHTHATPVEGEYDLASGDSGPVEILSTQVATGVQQCVVVFQGGSGGSTSLQYGQLTTDLTAATSFDPSDWGSAMFQRIGHDDGAPIGSPIEIKNDTFDFAPAGYVGRVDMSTDPPMAVVIYCTPGPSL